MKADNVAIIILAAGSSSRLGSSKQMLRIDGMTLLEKALDTAMATSQKNVVVVLGSEAGIHQQMIHDKIQHIIINQDWMKGIGSSLKAGLRYVINEMPSIEAVIVMVCDQPFITRDHLQQLIVNQQATGMAIVASAYAGTTGVPALFHKKLFGSILEAEDQHGAKKIIENNPDDAATVNFPEAAIDIDTPDDLKRFNENRL
jgi:molybdenum cofactor cytidylyltransferase